MKDETIHCGWAVAYLISWPMPEGSTQVVSGIFVSDARDEAVAIQEARNTQRATIMLHPTSSFTSVSSALKLDVKKATALLQEQGALPKAGPRKRELRQVLGHTVLTVRDIVNRLTFIRHGGGDWYLMSRDDLTLLQNAANAARDTWIRAGGDGK